MAIFSKLRDFLQRHRNKFIVTGVVITGTIFLTRYAQWKLRDWQEREAREIVERTRKQQHFENTERTCNQTILSLSNTLKGVLSNALDTEVIIENLRTNQPQNKVELWEELKILVFTRACTEIYLEVMLVITLRVQLNILGGFLYKDTNSMSSELQEKYLFICNSLLENGVSKISDIIKTEIEKILKPIRLAQELKLNDIENIFYALQTSIATSDSNPIMNFKEYLITKDVENGNEIFNTMIADTIDLLDSDEIKTLANHCVNRGFALLSDGISDYYSPNQKITEIPNDAEFVHPMEVKKPLAKLIPIVNGLVSNNTFSNNLTTQLISNAKVNTLGANVYECFCSAK